MVNKISQFCAQNSQRIVEWMHPARTRLEKFSSVLNSQLFLLSAALLIFRPNVLGRISSWTLLCIFEGVVLIFGILLLMNVDKNHKWILRAWPYVSILFELTIVIVINLQDKADDIPTVIAFLLFPVICETASMRTGIALMAYGVVMLAINNFDRAQQTSIIISIVNIFCTILLRLIVAYQKFAVPSSHEMLRSTKTIAKTLKNVPKILSGGLTDGAVKSISSVKPSPQTKIKKVVPIYGNNSKAMEDDVQSKII